MEQAQTRATASSPSLIPSGTVTFLFTDIEGSTERWEANRAAMKSALARHDELLSTAIKAHEGYIFKTIGDAYCAAFRTAPEAVHAAIDAQIALNKEDFSAVNGLRVRMAMHTGYADERDHDYFGPTVNRAARLLAIGHGGQILVSAAASDLLQGELPAHASLRSLGGHRLKDLAHPEQVFMLVVTGLPSEFPALRSLDSLPNNLPLQVTSFLGRDADVHEVKKLLEKTRLLTLAGTGGVGKTRLALQVGAEVLDQHPDGVWLIDLAGLQDPDLVISETASILGVRVGADRALTDSIIYALKPKRTLIIFDNCEHLIAAAAQITAAIIKGAPQVRVMTTSREALGIAGEVVHRVSSLGVPESSADITAQNATNYGAVALFIDRATAANTRFTLNDADARVLADICRSLDGIPFAIELAAARVKVMSVTHLAERLKERFRILTGGDRTALPRQQTMRALVDWSYNLLNERERTILNRVAVFAGGWTLEAASEICADDTIESWEILDLISSLVDKSLVVVEMSGTSERYRLLESTWQYAREKLAEAGESEVLNHKHAVYFLRIAQAADASWPSTSTNAWVGALEPELANFRAAMGWALVEKHDIDLGAALAGALKELWTGVGSRVEGVRWIKLALDALPNEQATLTTANLWLGLTINNEGIGAAGEEAAERALTQAQALDEKALTAIALATYAFGLDRRGRFDEAEATYLKAAPLLRETGNKKQLARVLSWWSIIHFIRRNSDAARKGFSEALAIARSLDDETLMATVLGNLAELAFAEGDVDKAIGTNDEALALRLKSKNPDGIANTFCNLTAYWLARNDRDKIRDYGRQAIYWGREAQAHLLIAYALQHMAVVGAREGRTQNAARLLGYVEEMIRKSEFAREPTEKWSYEKLMAALREQLKAEEIASLATEGSTWTEDQAVAEALKI
jgi:predicted ATPase/class 3 adenylate cyclase